MNERGAGAYPRWQYQMAGTMLVLAAIGIVASVVANIGPALAGHDGPYWAPFLVVFPAVAGLLAWFGLRWARHP